jgi:bacterial/archaeal transporter family protein
MWIFYAICSAFFGALVAIFGKIGLKNIDSTLATTVRSVVMAIILILTSLGLRKLTAGSLSAFSQRDWLWLVLAGAAGAISWLFYFIALKNGSAITVAALDRTSIAFVFILSLIYLQETFCFRSLAGVALIIVGAVILCLK